MRGLHFVSKRCQVESGKLLQTVAAYFAVRSGSLRDKGSEAIVVAFAPRLEQDGADRVAQLAFGSE